MLDSKKRKTTRSYKAYDFYKRNFFENSNLEKVLKQCRDYYHGRHYDDSEETINMPKPTFNLTREATEKVTSKLLNSTPYFIFVADTNEQNCNSIESYYEFLLKKINNKKIRAQVTRRALIDGNGISITSFDSDEIGKAKLKGFLKRKVILIEDCFFANPYCEDIQDQEYVGFIVPMQIKSVKELVEGKNKEEIKKKCEEIVPEDYYENENYYKDYDDDALNGKTINVYYRFFRFEGNVFYDIETKYVSLLNHPHSLQPYVNEEIANLKLKDLNKREKENNSLDKEFVDYDFDPQDYLVPSKVKQEDDTLDFKRKNKKFNLYPVAMFKPFPIEGSILGESYVSLLIANNKIIDYVALLIILIVQTSAMPKWVVKDGALRGQEIGNEPNQILVDYTPIGAGAGVSRIEGSAINNSIFTLLNTFIALTKDNYGFANIENTSGAKSGYAYEQEVKQGNLMWEQPLRELYQYDNEVAYIDLLYMTFYIDHSYYVKTYSNGELEMNEQYRNLYQDMINSGNASLPQGTYLEPLHKSERVEVDSEIFAHEYDIAIDIETGINDSEISEAQYFGEVFQQIATGQIAADKIRAFVENDPRFTNKLKQSISASLKALEVSQLNQKDQQIAQLTSQINAIVSQSNEAMQIYKKANTLMKNRYDALTQSYKENVKFNEDMLKAAQKSNSQNQLLSESEVKSKNAKGISGYSFDTSA